MGGSAAGSVLCWRHGGCRGRRVECLRWRPCMGVHCAVRAVQCSRTGTAMPADGGELGDVLTRAGWGGALVAGAGDAVAGEAATESVNTKPRRDVSRMGPAPPASSALPIPLPATIRGPGHLLCIARCAARCCLPVCYCPRRRLWLANGDACNPLRHTAQPLQVNYTRTTTQIPPWPSVRHCPRASRAGARPSTRGEERQVHVCAAVCCT